MYLVEEDMFVAADFFSFQRASQGGEAAGLGHAADPAEWKLIHSVMAHSLDTTGSPMLLEDCRAALAAGHDLSQPPTVANVLYSMNHFASLAISIDWRNLSLITMHTTPSYYTDLSGYIAENFPHAKRKPNMAPEQDGLIDREYKDKGLRAVWPRCPRAFHAGFISSYHPASMEGHPHQRIKSNHIEGETLPERYTSLMTKMDAESEKPGTGFKDAQSVVAPTEGYFADSLFYCKEYDWNQCHECLGCCPCDGHGKFPADGGPTFPGKTGSARRQQCSFHARQADCFIGGCEMAGGCSRSRRREDVEVLCSEDEKCAGLTEYGDGVGGGRWFETRSGAKPGASPSGEACFVKGECQPWAGGNPD